MSKEQQPINNQIEPDFLQFLKDHFKHWNELTAEGVEIGVRELSNFAFILKGAAMNSHLGFIYNFNPRAESAAGRLAITLSIYTDKAAYQSAPFSAEPQYYFECEI